MVRRSDSMMWSQLFALQNEDSRTLQFQIRTRILDAILDGTLPPGMSMPSSRKLADELEVSRNTVILSYQHLADEGFLVARERSGFVVARRPASERITRQPEGKKQAPVDWSMRIRSQARSFRSIEKPSNWQAYTYPFLYGQFDPSIFPLQAWRQCCRQALGVLELRDWGRDTIDEDDPLLIEQLRSRVLPRRGIWAEKSEILVTLGTQQALYLLSEALFGAETVVGVEEPGYPDMRNIAQVKGCTVQPLNVDEEGLELTPALAACDYVHVTPSHQCPTTVTMSATRRRDLLALIESSNTVLIEDDYDSETSFDGAPQPALKSLDSSGRVIYVASLSKTLAPGLRLGFIVADAALIQELRALRRLMVRHPPLNNQRAVALFLSLGHYESLVVRLTDAYRRRAGILTDALSRHIPEGQFRAPVGGSCVWFQAPGGFDARAACEAWRRKGLLFEPGDVFFADARQGVSHLRLGYSVIAQDRIVPGVALLAEAVANGKG